MPLVFCRKSIASNAILTIILRRKRADMQNSIKETNLKPLMLLAQKYGVELPPIAVNKSRRLNALKLRKILLYLIEKTDNKNIPLELGQLQSIERLEDLGKYVQYVSVMSEVCQILERYYSIVHTGISPKFEVDDNYFSVELIYKQKFIQYIRFPAEIILSAFQKQFSELCGFNVEPKKVEFFHKQGSALKGFSEVFNCEVHFNQRRNKMYFDKSLYHLPIKHTNEALAKVYQHKVQYEFTVFEDNLIETISSIIKQNLIGTLPTLNEISRMINIPTRTIQHRLKEKNSSYKALCTHVRMHKAKELLRDDASVETVSFLIGYQNSPAFCKAFKKHCVQTPSEYKEVDTLKTS